MFCIGAFPAEEERATNDVSMFLKGLCLVTCYLIKTVIISLPPNTCCQGFRTSAVWCNKTLVWCTVVDITKRFSL